MKKIITAAVLMLICAAGASAQCKIECVRKKGMKEATDGPKSFILTLDNFINDSTAIKHLVSDGQGIVFIDPTTFNKLEDRTVVGFNFQDNMNREYYRTPVEFDAHIKLSELCGKKLTADSRFD
jgi:hypothetical protein